MIIIFSIKNLLNITACIYYVYAIYCARAQWSVYYWIKSIKKYFLLINIFPIIFYNLINVIIENNLNGILNRKGKFTEKKNILGMLTVYFVSSSVTFVVWYSYCASIQSSVYFTFGDWTRIFKAILLVIKFLHQ